MIGFGLAVSLGLAFWWGYYLGCRNSFKAGAKYALDRVEIFLREKGHLK